MRVYKRHQIQPDETIYSWITRLYILSIFSSETKFYKDMLGTGRVRFHPYLPAHLSRIASLTSLNNMDLLINHTLYPLFSWFDIEVKEELKQAMLSDNGGTVVQKARLTNVNFSFYHGHKYCPVCAAEDIERLGFCYFKLFHQIPGVDTCYRHKCLLHGIDCGDFGCDRHLVLPNPQSSILTASKQQIALANFSLQVLDISQHNHEPCQYQVVYHRFLEEHNLLTNNGQLFISTIIKQLKGAYIPDIFKTKLGFPKELFNFQFVGPLLRNKTHFPCHPTKHIILANWLFDGDVNAYLSKFNNKPQSSHNSLLSYYLDAEIISFLKSGQSMNQIEQLTSRSRCYIRRVAELNNIQHTSNASSYSSSLRHSVLIQAQLGRHRKSIAKNLSVGIGYVEQVISNTPGLVSWRKRLWIMIKINEAVRVIKNARKKHPYWLRKDIKEHCNQAFFYLYRQARDTLEELLPLKTLPQTPRKNWQVEDERLLDAISILPDVNTLSLTAIGHQTNDHAHLRRKLNCLPKTKAFLIKLGKIKNDYH